MTDSKHTPGPWSVDGPADNQIVWSGQNERVCFLAHSNGRDTPRDIATGLLIAAAPDLLRFAEKVRDYARETDDESLYAAADDLISKAEGK
jgi:hypothetical protein